MIKKKIFFLEIFSPFIFCVIICGFLAGFSYIHFDKSQLLYSVFYLLLTAGLSIVLSIDFLKNWKFIKEQNENQMIADSKTNFISLISHNLNTPIAKMQALLELIYQPTIEKNVREDLQIIFSHLSNMQISIKILLVTTSIDDLSLSSEAVTVDMIRNEFFKTLYTPIQRLGIEVSVQCSSDKEDLAHVPLRVDKRALSTVLCAMAILIGQEKCHICLTVAEREEDNHFIEVLICEVFSFSKENKKQHYESDLLIDISSNIINSIKKYYKGHLEWHKRENYMSLTLVPDQTMRKDSACSAS
jgi:hypothetical protein